jgi:hypothetical protein
MGNKSGAGPPNFVSLLRRPVFIPNIAIRSSDQGIVLLAFLSRVMGIFLHAAQSLATYVGNANFKTSWAAWYVLRP